MDILILINDMWIHGHITSKLYNIIYEGLIYSLLFQGSSEMVNVTHIVDPSCFYVQIVQNQQKISDLSKGLATLATTGIIPAEITLSTITPLTSSLNFPISLVVFFLKFLLNTIPFP